MRRCCVMQRICVSTFILAMLSSLCSLQSCQDYTSIRQKWLRAGYLAASGCQNAPPSLSRRVFCRPWCTCLISVVAGVDFMGLPCTILLVYTCNGHFDVCQMHWCTSNARLLAQSEFATFQFIWPLKSRLLVPVCASAILAPICATTVKDTLFSINWDSQINKYIYIYE